MQNQVSINQNSISFLVHWLRRLVFSYAAYSRLLNKKKKRYFNCTDALAAVLISMQMEIPSDEAAAAALFNNVSNSSS